MVVGVPAWHGSRQRAFAGNEIPDRGRFVSECPVDPPSLQCHCYKAMTAFGSKSDAR
jgi:hypothetical protein